MTFNGCSINCITPPHILIKLLESKDKQCRERAIRTLAATLQLRTRRQIMGVVSAAPSAGGKHRTIYDAKNQEIEGGTVARREGDSASGDVAVNEAYDHLGTVYDFYDAVHGRSSIDDNGMRLDGVVHFGDEYNNAYWNGSQMVFGDGDGIEFIRFTKSLDVVAHELAHGVTEHTAGLVYHKQPGALNESFSDIFGSLVKQWHLDHAADEADWLVGGDIFSPNISGDALRSLADPGNAYDDPTLGKDPQPAHMDDYLELPDTFFGDWGGVHINSGIPNHAFYLAAMEIGGNAWEDAGLIWYNALQRLSTLAQFTDCANATMSVAVELFGSSSDQATAVKNGWDAVGVSTTPAAAPKSKRRKGKKGKSGTDQPADLKEDLKQVAKSLKKILEKLE